LSIQTPEHFHSGEKKGKNDSESFNSPCFSAQKSISEGVKSQERGFGCQRLKYPRHSLNFNQHSKLFSQRSNSQARSSNSDAKFICNQCACHANQTNETNYCENERGLSPNQNTLDFIKNELKSILFAINDKLNFLTTYQTSITQK
jgi:hypothetical protein